MAVIRRRKLFHLLALIAIFLLAIQLVIAEEYESDALSDFEVEESVDEVDRTIPTEVPAPDVVDLVDNSDAEKVPIVPEPVVVDENTETLAVVEDNAIVTIDEPTLTEDVTVEDTIIIEAAVSSLGESVSSKLISIADRIKGLAISKQNAKKIAAAGLGAWGAATGVGWAMQNFGGGKKLVSN